MVPVWGRVPSRWCGHSASWDSGSQGSDGVPELPTLLEPPFFTFKWKLYSLPLPPVRAEDSRSGAQILGWGCLEMAASASWCFPFITGGPEHRVPGFPHIQEETCPSKAPCLLVSSPASHGKLTHVKQFPSGSHFAATEQGGFQVMI